MGTGNTVQLYTRKKPIVHTFVLKKFKYAENKTGIQFFLSIQTDLTQQKLCASNSYIEHHGYI